MNNNPAEKLKNWELPLPSGAILRGQRTQPSGGKPVIHFVHGNGFCCRTYLPMLDILSNQFDLFMVDIPGQGDSDPCADFQGWNGTARLVATAWQEFRSEYNGSASIGMGHSLGATLTSLIVAEQPDYFSGLILLDPVLFPPKMLMLMKLISFFKMTMPNPLIKKALRRRRVWASEQEVKKDFQGRGIFKNWHEAALDAHIKYALKPDQNGRLTLKCDPQQEAAFFASFPEDLWQLLESIKLNGRIFYGKETDGFMRKAIGVLSQQPNFSSHEVRGGHCFMQEEPELSAQLVMESAKNFFEGS